MSKMILPPIVVFDGVTYKVLLIYLPLTGLSTFILLKCNENRMIVLDSYLCTN